MSRPSSRASTSSGSSAGLKAAACLVVEPTRPPALVADEAPRAGAGGRRTSVVQQQQERVNRLLAEPTVDWASLRLYAHGTTLNPNHTDPRTLVNTAHRSAYAGEATVLRWCLRMGAAVDARTTMGRSALHYACDGNAPACIRVLLEWGADANLGTLSSLTPLHVCCDWGHLEATLELLGSTRQNINVDARARADAVLAEDLAKDPRLCHAIQRYRAARHEQQRAELRERAVRRLFRAVDRAGKSHVLPEEWAESQALLLRHLGSQRRPAPCPGGRASWEEFRAAHLQLIEESEGDLKYLDLMSQLASLEGGPKVDDPPPRCPTSYAHLGA